VSTSDKNVSTPAAERWQVHLLGIYLIATAVLLAYAATALWPTTVVQDGGKKIWDPGVHLFGRSTQIPDETRMILIVIVSGALGSFVHAATSFGTYVGNQRIYASWIWWYVLRPFLGMGLALILYYVVYGGLLSTGVSAETVNPFGIAAIAGMTGMFAKQATDKLNETFTTLFKTSPDKGDAERKDKLDNPLAIVSGVEPASFAVGAEERAIVLKGARFVHGSSVCINADGRPTTFVSETKLMAVLLPSDLENERELDVTVWNPPPGGGASLPVKVKVAPGAPSATEDPRHDILITPAASGVQPTA
jgi:hypothetical protein